MCITTIHSTIRQSAHSSICQGRFFHENGKKVNNTTPFPDLQLAKTFKSKYERTEEGEWTLGMALRYSKTMTSYWRVATVMQQKGLIPFVHGQTAVWSIPQRIIKALGFRGCQLLRFPKPDSLKTSSEITQRIDSIIKEKQAKKDAYPLLSRCIPFIFRGCPLDHTPELRTHLLAVTIGLFHLDRKESPLSFVIGGAYGSGISMIKVEGNRNILPLEECKKIANEMITEAVTKEDYDPHISGEILRNIDHLYKQAAQLPIGQLLVCGVPYDRLSNYVYHSAPLGAPTGLPMHRVLEDLPHGSQARLLLCQETMTPNSPIEVVNIMDECETQEFCRDLGPCLLPELEEGLKDVIDYTHQEIEEREIAQIKALYEKIDGVIETSLLGTKKLF
ncbi:MAG: hypothetical protein WA347_08490 [Rhabdochlamydiaceae bacterium]